MKFRFKINGKSRWFGETDLKNRRITINKKKAKAKGKLGETIYHELDHAKHPKKHEKTVYQDEKKFHQMSKKQKSKIYAKAHQKSTTLKGI